MLWVLDVGNTKIASSFYDLKYQNPVCVGDYTTSTDTGMDGIQQGYQAFTQNHPQQPIQRMIVSSVVKTIHGAALKQTFPTLPLHQISPADKIITISPEMPFPEKIGQDRLLNAVAVKGQQQFPCLVADIGTATTVDYIDENAVFQGGIITVGANMMLSSLHHQTSQLPLLNLTEQPSSVLGRCTETAMKAGAFWGMRGIISEIRQQFQREIGFKLPLIATGGGAWIIQDSLDHPDHYNPFLTRQGLFYYDQLLRQ